MKDPVKIMPDGREICQQNRAGRIEYRNRTEKMARRQKMICGICEDPANPMSLALGFDFSATFEHEDGRGMGGAKRNDAIWKDGKPYNRAAHYICNMRKGCVSLEKFKQTVSKSSRPQWGATSSPTSV